jgi:photosystem II stability/assembly factor-like uncharacterized protein
MKKLLLFAIFITFKLHTLAQTITVTYPDGGETLIANNSDYITWTDQATSQVKLEYSTNGGSTWNFITNATSSFGIGFYQWTVPAVTSTNCLVRASLISNPADFDISDNTFEIGAPYISLFYPSGAESFAIGSSEEITWYAPGVDFIDIEYSINGGSTFLPIASNVNATLNSYTWNPIPNTPSNTCKVRLKQSSNASVSDISNFDFSIQSAGIVVESPNGGEVITANTGNYINWTPTGVNEVNIEYSVDNGSTWTNIVSNATGTWYWWDPVPNTPSSSCLIRITDATNASLSDVSDATFTISGGSIDLNYPNGGQTWASGSVNEIWWYSPGIDDVKIEYSYDSMATWNTIISNYTINNSYDWTVPNTPSTHCFVKVSNSNDLSIFDISDSEFTIAAPSLTIIAPNGGETYESGNTYYLQFEDLGVDSVMIEYSTDGGINWNLISSSFNAYDGNNFYTWLVPNSPSNNCLLRIKDVLNGVITDVSDFPFAIVFGGLPDCANNLYPADATNGFSKNPTFTWTQPTGTVLVNAYDLYLGTSTNPPLYQANINFLHFEVLGLNPSTTYYWKVVPKSINGEAVGCIINTFTTSGIDEYNMDNQSEIVCIGTFYDASGPSAFYNNNEDYVKTFLPSTAGQVLKFDFTSFESENNYDRLYVYDGNATTAPLIGSYSGVNGPGSIVATNPQGALTFKWYADGASNYNGWQASISCVSTGTQAINLTSPNGGESWIANTNHNITWTSQNVPNVNIEYSVDSGLTWLSVASNIVNTGSYNWQVPLPASTQCIVRVISASNFAISDESNAVFEIQYVPIYIDLISPNTAVTYLVGTLAQISWNSMFVADVQIEYSTDAGTNWNTIIASTPSVDGYNTFNWTVPNTPSNLCLVRVTDLANSSVNDASQSAFYIVTPYLEITAPNGGELLSGGTYSYIEWSGYINSGFVKLEYTNNNGASWNLISGNVNHYNGSPNYYYWFVANVNSSNCRIRVTENATPTINDESNNTFTINGSASNITIVQPNGGETLNGGLSYQIQWNASFTSSQYRVQFSSNNGTSWITIANNVYNTGYYNWMVPNTSLSNCLIRVNDILDTNVFDQSNATFNIAPTSAFISNVVPNGGETLTAGNYSPISWSSSLVSNVNILFSSDGGNTYTTIVNNYSNINYYNWLVPNVTSSNCIIKIVASNDSTLFDTSDATFSIGTGTPFLTLITPNGGENYLSNSPNNIIKWTGSGIGNAIKLEYSIDGGANWLVIISSFASVNNNYSWFTPNVVSSQCLVRISSTSNLSLTDVSDAQFAINSSTPTLTVNSPNGGDYLNQGYWYNITWSRNNVPLVNLSYSTDNGSSWNSLLSGVNADSYYWNVPAVSSTQCLVKVEKSGLGAALSDESDAIFTIGPVLPNANGIVIDSINPLPFCKLDTVYVYFTATGIYNTGNSFDVQLSDSVGNFANPTLIGHLVSNSNSGVIACLVPTTIGNGLGYRIRIQSSDLPSTSNDNGLDIVINSPQFDFAANNLIKYLPDGAVTFFVIPQQSGTASYSWDFGDGGTSTAAQPLHNYTNIGKFDVSCTIVDAGCTVSVEKANYIRVEQLFPSVALNTNTNVDITSVSMLSPDTALMTLKDGNCLSSFDGGITWNISLTGAIPGVDTLLSCDLYPNKWRVVGSNGLIKESTNNGQTWTLMNSTTTQRMYGVATFNANNAFAVGDNGVILNYDGTNWVNQNVGVTTRFWDVDVDKTAPTPTAYAVGSGGTIYKYDGTTWAPQNSGLSAGLFGTSAVGNNVVYAVGGLTQGLILKTTNGGLTWNTVLNGVDVSFRSVTAIADTAWACAFDGIIYETRDGGSSWVRYSVGDTYNNNGIIFKTSKGVVAGNGGNGRNFGLSVESTDTTGLKKNQYAPDQLLLFPNPAENIVYMKGKFKNTQIVNFTIKDIDGKIVLNLPSQRLLQGDLNYALNVSKLNNGVYFVFTDDGVQSFVKKLVITH